MIHESRDWKNELKKNNRYVLKNSTIDSMTDELKREDIVQIKLSINALISRRLMETPKIDSKFISLEINAVSYPNGEAQDSHLLAEAQSLGPQRQHPR